MSCLHEEKKQRVGEKGGGQVGGAPANHIQQRQMKSKNKGVSAKNDS